MYIRDKAMQPGTIFGKVLFARCKYFGIDRYELVVTCVDNSGDFNSNI